MSNRPLHVVPDPPSTRPAPESWELAVVMPVYNESECIADVVTSWVDVLESMGIRARVWVIDDGSTDATPQALGRFVDHPMVEVVRKPNEGHGPTVLAGYRRAVAVAEWVFQVDSDDEMSAVHFHRLWDRRDGHDALFGRRAGRVQSAPRRIVSAVSRLAVRALFGGAVRDVNTPYRLMRGSALGELLEHIPDDTFAPNVPIAGAFARRRDHVLEIPVPHVARRTGTESLAKLGIWRVAVRALWQTLALAPKLRRRT